MNALLVRRPSSVGWCVEAPGILRHEALGAPLARLKAIVHQGNCPGRLPTIARLRTGWTLDPLTGRWVRWRPCQAEMDSIEGAKGGAAA